MKIFERYFQDNVVNWFIWAQKNQLGVERMEDLILVSGCTLVTKWAAAVFTPDHSTTAKITLESRTPGNNGPSFVWNIIQGPVVYHNSRFESVRSPGYCVLRYSLTFSCCMESKILPRLLISVSLSRVSVQGAASSGSNFELRENPFPTTLPITEMVTYR